MNAEEDIERRAHELWEAEGRPDSRALDHWFQAKEETACKALGSATYKATQQGSVVTVTANGALPRHGMQASLENNRLEPDDPDYAGVVLGYMLLFRPVGPLGEAGPVAFQATATFEYQGSVNKVLVFDRYGPHMVKVARPRVSVTKPEKVVPVLKSPAPKRSRK